MEVNPSDVVDEGDPRRSSQRTFEPVARAEESRVHRSTSHPTCRRRSSPTDSGCSRCSRTCCRTRSSSPSAGASRSRSARRRHAALRQPQSSTAPRRRDRVRGARHGHRHSEGQAAAHLRGVPAGRRHDEPQVRRHRTRAVDQPRDRAPPRRRDSRGEHAGTGEHVHAVSCQCKADAGRREGRRGAPTRDERRRRAACQVRARSGDAAGRCEPRSSHVSMVETLDVFPTVPVLRPRSPRSDDDRESIEPGDRVVLIIENDTNFARHPPRHGARERIQGARRARRRFRAATRARISS